MGSGWTGGSGISEPVDLTQELTVSTGELASDVANGAQAVGFTLDTNNSLSTSGAKLLSLRNNSTEKAYFDKDGALYVGGQRVAISTYSVVTDLDFTAEATQTITSDTTWTIGGLTWRSLNYAAASTFAVTSGTGLQIGSTTSKTWDNTGRSAAVFYLQLSDLSASITARTPLRLRGRPGLRVHRCLVIRLAGRYDPSPAGPRGRPELPANVARGGPYLEYRPLGDPGSRGRYTPGRVREPEGRGQAVAADFAGPIHRCPRRPIWLPQQGRPELPLPRHTREEFTSFVLSCLTLGSSGCIRL